MNQIEQELQEIIGLTKRLLSEEYHPQEWFCSDPETYRSMKDYALGLKDLKPRSQTAPRYSPPKRHSPAQMRMQPPSSRKIVQLEESKGVASEEIPASHEIQLQKLSDVKEENFGDIRKIIKEKRPEVVILDNPPDDRKAKELSQKWKGRDLHSVVLVLSFDHNPKHIQFLQRLAQAIEEYHMPAKVIPIDQWDDFLLDKARVVLGVENCVAEEPRLQNLMQKTGEAGNARLGSCPLLFLAPISHYLQDPEKKAPLWKEICGILQNG